MMEKSIKEICEILKKQFSTELSDKVALDFFARDGSWQAMHYAKKVKKTYAWEIDPVYENDLIENLPDNSEITIGDSFKLSDQYFDFFDLVVLDNPQGCYGENNKYCEHFEALECAIRVMKKEGGLLIFNVKTTPFNYEDNLVWQKRRNSFYSLQDASNLSHNFILNFYKKYFEKRGYDVSFAFLTDRPQESGLFSMTMEIKNKL